VESTEYEKLTRYEDWYWWYRAERRAVMDALSSLRLRKGARVLDAGCGSGRNLTECAKRFDIVPYGIDVSPHAAKLWNGCRTFRQGLGSVNELPYAEGVFDAILSVDVLYCAQVDPQQAVREMARVLKVGGFLLAFVPAYQWLRSSHDVAVHGARRFSRRSIQNTIAFTGMTMLRSHHLFSPFFPAIALTRFARKRRAPRRQSDLAPLPPAINTLLYGVAVAEQHVAKVLPPPWGTTIVTIARKDR
jgi:SAM-dependent methyltransferase